MTNRVFARVSLPRHSFPRIRRAAAAGIVLAACGISAGAPEAAPVQEGRPQELSYQPVDIPGASLTNAQGINARGDIVGFYSAGGVTHGFLLRDGVVTPIDYPGAAYTDARGINAAGDIVGAYRRPGEPAVNAHGYLLTRDGDFRPIDVPGHTSTIAQRITASGLVVGCRHDADMMTSMRGVAIDPEDQAGFEELDAFGSMTNGAAADGNLLAGLFMDMDTNRGRGFVVDRGTFIPFDVPGSTFTAGWDVNARGDVVGVYRDARGLHGFLWGGESFHAIDYPGATATRAFGINARGTIVGMYLDAANRVHGFVARRAGEED